MARQNLTPKRMLPNGRANLEMEEVMPDGYKLAQSNAELADRGSTLDRTVVVVDRAEATGNLSVVVRAGDPHLALAAGQGDFTIACPAGEVSYLGPFDGSRFKQSDGSVTLDVTGSVTDSLVGALVLPKAV